MSYSSIGNFGYSMNPVMSNPLSYCAVSGLDAMFNHTTGYNLDSPDGQQCQLFMSQYCGNKWDGVCEYMSKDEKRGAYPNTVQKCGGPNGSCFSSGIGNQLTKGQVLIRNSMAERFLKKMSGNCQRNYEPFDPTVADSPLVSRWMPTNSGCQTAGACNNSACIPIYGVDYKTIDQDPIMNKVLNQPWIAMDILVNIYNNAVLSGYINLLKGTKIYRLFSTPQFQQIVKERVYTV